jgi:predicted CXXCH cytochrome family protein
MTKTKPLNKKKPNSKRINPKFLWTVIITTAAFGLAVVLTVGGFSFAASKEQHDSFCISCHTQPESTFYERGTASHPVDLASAHSAKNTRCIDCHSGHGVFGRISAELLGAHNALAFYTKTAVQPAVVTRPVGDDACLKCHQNITDQQDMNNHFHVFLSRWQKTDPNAATCVSCHQGHNTNGEAQLAYLNQETTTAVCESCHRTLGGGD